MKFNIAFFESNASKILFYVIVLFLGILTIERFAMAFSYNDALEGFDNNFVYPVIRLLQGKGIYPDAGNYPFVVNPYAPLLFYISYLAAKLTGISGEEVIQVYYVTRTLCVIFDLATTAVLFKLLNRKAGLGRILALSISVSYLFVINQWGFTFNRSDSLVLLLFVGFLWQLVTFMEKRSVASLVLLAAICCMAILAKQTAVVTPVIAGAVLLWQKEWKQFFLFSVSFLVLLSLPLLVISILGPDEHLFQHLVKAVSNRVDFKWFYVNVYKILVTNYVIIPLLTAIFIALRQVASLNTDKVFTAISISLLITSVFTLGIATKWGAHIGYFHEVLLLSACILGIQISRLSRTVTRLSNTFMLGYSFLFLVLAGEILMKNYLFYLNNFSTDKLKYEEQKEIAGYIKKHIRPNEEFVYAPTDHTVDFFKNLLVNEMAAPNLDIITCCTFPDGNFNYNLLRQGFSNGRIKFIISKKAVPLENPFNVDLGPYKLIRQYENFEIYQFIKPG